MAWKYFVVVGIIGFHQCKESDNTKAVYLPMDVSFGVVGVFPASYVLFLSRRKALNQSLFSTTRFRELRPKYSFM
jgi:hypothetical protein